MTSIFKFSHGDKVIIDRVVEILKFGASATKFSMALYRAEGVVTSVVPWRVEWFNLGDGKSRGTHGAGIPPEFLIHAGDVGRISDGMAESPSSFAHRLSKALGEDDRHEGTEDASEAGRIESQQPETPSEGLASTEHAGRGAALAHGDRQKAYGHPKVSFDRIARLWSTYLSAPEVDPYNLTAEDHGQMMNLLKISRSITDKGDDTLDDIEGYVTCVRMIREAEADN